MEYRSVARVEILLLLADVAGVAVLVPDLDLHARRFVGIVDVKVVEPLLANNIPAWRQHDNPAVGEFRQVMLNAPVAERVIDAVLLALARQIRIRDVEGPVSLRESEFLAAEDDPAAGKITLDGSLVAG